MKKYLYFLILVVALSGCKSSQKTVLTTPLVPEVVAPQYLSSRLQLTLPEKVGGQELSGTMKMRKGELIQISLLMPVFRTEILRLEVTPDQMLLIDRMNRRYVLTNGADMKRIFRGEFNFGELEKILTDASKAGGSTLIKGTDLGLTPFGDAEIRFFDFSTKPVDLEPSKLSDRYKQIPIEQLMKMLQNSL